MVDEWWITDKSVVCYTRCFNNSVVFHRCGNALITMLSLSLWLVLYMTRHIDCMYSIVVNKVRNCRLLAKDWKHSLCAWPQKSWCIELWLITVTCYCMLLWHGLTFGSSPILMLFIPNQFYCRHIWCRHTTVCWRHPIVCITDYDRHPCLTVVTLWLPICFAQLVLSQRPLPQ